MVWGGEFVEDALPILGDNLGSLNSALKLRGRGPMLAIAREISWRQARRGWLFELGHLPSEVNSVADALSRVADPKGHAWPREALAAAQRDKAPRLQYLWQAAPS